MAAHAMLASLEYLPTQKAEAAQLMYDILQSPEVGSTPLFFFRPKLTILRQAFFTHTRRYSNSVICPYYKESVVRATNLLMRKPFS